MSLLVLFPDGVAPAASGDVVTSMLIETGADTWYDATTDLISGEISRGRQTELDLFQAGTCQVLLDNDDRKYDPTYASSPLAGYVLPMKRIQVRNTWNGTTYPTFTGYADRWTQNQDGPHRGTTSLQATDGFKVLERARLASSAYAQEILADEPTAWWRLDEDGGTIAYDTIGDLDLAAFGIPELGTVTLIARDPGGSMTTASSNDGFYREGPVPITTGPLSMELVIKGTGTGLAAGQITYLQGTGFALDPTGGFQIATAAGVGANATSTVSFNDNLPHHIVGVWNTDGSVRIWVDGTDTTIGSPTTPIVPFPLPRGTVLIGNDPVNNFGGMVGIYDEVVFYDHALSADRIAAHYAAKGTPWDGDLPGERINRVLDAVGWSDADRNIDDGSTTLQSATLDMSALAHVQQVSLTEAGNIYMTAAGTVRFEARTSAVNQPVLYTFSDQAGGDLAVTFSDAEISDEHIRNDITVSRLEGIAQNTRDATSIATYQISSFTRDGLYHDDDAYSRYLAQFLLEAYKDPSERVSQMSVNPYRDPPTLWPAVLAIELTDRVVYNETPSNVAPEVSRTLVVEGIRHQFGPKVWQSSFNVSENVAATQAYWQLGVAGYSELDQTTRLYF